MSTDEFTDTNLDIVRRLLDAGSNQERAALLLPVPDAIILSHAAQIRVALIASGFEAGDAFIIHREAALHAVRDAHGIMPWRVAYNVEGWRGIMSDYAAGKLDQGALASAADAIDRT